MIPRQLIDPPSRAMRFFWSALALLPLLALARFVWKYGVDVPFFDQWALISLLEHDRQGTLSFAEIWRFHNEHRMPFPKLVMIGLARLTHWNIRCELAVVIALAAMIFATLVYMLRIAAKRVERFNPWPLLPLFSLVVFSLNQWENWLWGWQIHLFMGVTGVVVGLGALSAAVFGPSRLRLFFLFASVCAGIVGSYSFGNGLLFWVVAIPLVACWAMRLDRKRAMLLCLFWITVSAAVISFYFYGDPMHKAASVVLSVPVRLLRATLFALTFLGAPVLEVHQRHGSEYQQLWVYSALVGYAGFVILVWGAWLLRRSRKSLEAFLPLLSLSLYAAGSAFVIGVGRGCASIALAAEAVRYVTISSCFWFAVLALLLWIACGAEKEGVQSRSRRTRRLAGTLLVLFLCMILVRWWNAREGFHYRHGVLVRGRAALIANRQGPDLDALYPDRQIVADLRQTLQRYHLSLFRDKPKATSPD